jgi:COG4 transport protein
MVEKIVNYRCEIFIQQKFFPTMQNFFDLSSPIIKSIMAKIPIDDSIDLNGCLAQGASQVSKYRENIDSLQIFCEEISDISNQCELFKKHIFKIMFTEGNSEILKKARENDKNDQNYYTKKLDNLMMNRSIMEGLDKFFYYQRFILKFQIIHIVQTSQVIKSTWNYEKAFFMDFNNMNEEISEQTKLFEYLDDFFYLMKNSASKALSTRNKSIACAFLNYLTNTIIGEDLVKIVNDVFNKYIKKEFFTGSMMSFSPTNNVYNTIVVVLFNNTERILSYLKNLKETLLEDYHKLFGEDKENQMILHSIEEMENQNIRTFTGILDEKFKYFTEYLKNTVHSSIHVNY